MRRCRGLVSPSAPRRRTKTSGTARRYGRHAQPYGVTAGEAPGEYLSYMVNPAWQRLSRQLFGWSSWRFAGIHHYHALERLQRMASPFFQVLGDAAKPVYDVVSWIVKREDGVHHQGIHGRTHREWRQVHLAYYRHELGPQSIRPVQVYHLSLPHSAISIDRQPDIGCP